MDLKKFATQIQTTGFPLEHKIATHLRSAGWSVIANKYYIDDLEETVREIDLIAYRVSDIYNIAVYTTLIISCKKSETNAWILLSRPINSPDPNTDFEPLHAWSNDSPLSHMISRSTWSHRYYLRARQLGVRTVLDTPSRDIFAFQEMNRDSGKPHNDKAIFSAITSLMKAQAYELDALPKRRKEPAIYQFNLLNVVDSDMVRLDFDDPSANATATSVTDEVYVARYIINKRQTFSRIQFLTAGKFPALIDDYKKLHDANCAIFAEAHDQFYENIFEDGYDMRYRVLLEKFQKQINWSIWHALHTVKGKAKDVTIPWIRSHKGNLYIALDETDDDDIEFLNSDESVKKGTAEALKRVYRYVGAFEFESADVPF
ncbi:hypothetical protein [Sorangium sp. So ce406]|uniref:hypothetical protein n=1 Tax=Sorangium sp. So ce406 TaxID=3133311 RepID=UPI003F5C68E0